MVGGTSFQLWRRVAQRCLMSDTHPGFNSRGIGERRSVERWPSQIAEGESKRASSTGPVLDRVVPDDADEQQAVDRTFFDLCRLVSRTALEHDLRKWFCLS